MEIEFPLAVDLHVHGGGGADCMDGAGAVHQMAAFHYQNGTGALLATTVTAPLEKIEFALEGIAAAMQSKVEGEAKILGVHLEGPFINPNKLGAQPSFALLPDVALVSHLRSIAPIKVVTLAPEMAGAIEMIEFLVSENIRVQVGHSLATFEQTQKAFDAGASSLTHFYNAMSGLHQREAGVVGYGLLSAKYAELIADGQHVGEGAFRVATKSIPNCIVITDAVSAAGMPDGEYRLGENHVFKKDEGVFLSDGTFAGSTLTMNRAIENLQRWGYSRAQIVAMTSENALNYLGTPPR